MEIKNTSLLQSKSTQPQHILNKDGTITIITTQMNDEGEDETVSRTVSAEEAVQLANNQQLMLRQSDNSSNLGNRLTRYKAEEKRMFVMDSKFTQRQPFIFEVDRGDGEKMKVMYQEQNDTFFQLQESINECSTFIGKAIAKETKVYVVTECDPMFFLLNSLMYGKEKVGMQSLSQILDQSIYNHQSDATSLIMNPFHVDEQLTHQSTQQASSYKLKELLLNSQRVKNSLMKICEHKDLSIGDAKFKVYRFDQQKFLNILVDKHSKIKKMLASNYVKTHSQEESKLLVKQEIIQNKRHVKKEEDDAPMEESKAAPFSSKAYESMFQTVATGMIADELPKQLINAFILEVQGDEQQQVASPVQMDKKRTYVENAENVEPVAAAVMPQLQEQNPKPPVQKKKPAEAPKNNTSLDKFFRKSATTK